MDGTMLLLIGLFVIEKYLATMTGKLNETAWPFMMKLWVTWVCYVEDDSHRRVVSRLDYSSRRFFPYECPPIVGVGACVVYNAY